MTKAMNLNEKEVQILLDVFDIVEESCGGLLKAQANLKKKIKKLLGPRILVSSAKAKGRNLQQLVCRNISVMYNVPYDQSDDCCDIHSREMGQPGVDIILRGEIGKKFHFAIECKNAERLDLRGAIDQAQFHGEKLGRAWAVVYKNKTLKAPIAILDWGVLLYLEKRSNDAKR